MQAEVQSQVDATAEVTVDAELGIETLSEAYLNQEALAEAKMIEQEEYQLNQQTKADEKEKNKFIGVLSEIDKDIIN